MPDRYEKIDWKNFSGGEGQRYNTRDLFKYHASSKVTVDPESNKLRLEKTFTVTALAFAPSNYVLAYDSTYIYTVIYDSGASRWKLYRSTDGVTFSLAYTFGVGQTDSVQCVVKKGYLIVWFDSGHIALSSDQGGTFSVTAVGSTIPVPAMFVDMPELGEYVYMQANVDEVWRTKDFTSFEKMIAGQGRTDIEQLFVFDGFIYYLQGYVLYQIINGKPLAIRTFERYPRVVSIGKDVVTMILDDLSDVAVQVLLFDGAEFTYKQKVLGYRFANPLFEAGGSAYYQFVASAAATTGDIYRMEKDGSLFRIYSAVPRFVKGIRFKSWDIFLSEYNDSVYKSNNYVLSGTFDLSIVDEGEIIPVGLAVRHKPLTSGCEVNLFVKKDQAASWGSAVLANTTASSVKKKYKYPNAGPVVDFFQVQVELKTNNAANTPEDVSVEFLYLPAGLRNAK